VPEYLRNAQGIVRSAQREEEINEKRDEGEEGNAEYRILNFEC
jgi:hypothetical protein